MIVPVMAISNLVLTQQIYSEETNGAHAHYREPVPLICDCFLLLQSNLGWHNGKNEINNMHVQASNKLITIFLEYRLTLPSFQF